MRLLSSFSLPKIFSQFFPTGCSKTQSGQQEQILFSTLEKKGDETFEIPIQRVNTPKEASEQLIDALDRLICIAEANFVEGIMELEQNRTIELAKNVKLGLEKYESYNDIHIKL